MGHQESIDRNVVDIKDGKKPSIKLVLIAMRVHLFPSRTQKLSSFAPTILGGRLPGKIGNANTNPLTNRPGGFFYFICGGLEMRDVRFEYLNREEYDKILPDLFQILHSNMSVIAPTNLSYDEDFKIWISNIYPSLQDDFRRTVLINVDGMLIGYFRYSLNLSSLLMEDIQIISEYQGSGVFSLLYKWLVKELPQSIETVEAYANMQNSKSIGVLEHLGLCYVGVNKTGKSFHYKGDYSSLLKKYS